jgi:hypothetical protein
VANIGVTAPTLAVASSAVFTVKPQNNGTLPGRIHYLLQEGDACPGYFAFRVTVGALNVTAPVRSGDYATASLAPGAAVSLRVTMTYLQPGGACSGRGGSDDLDGTARDDHGDSTDEFMVVNPIASN